jgi:hypothetical protein
MSTNQLLGLALAGCAVLVALAVVGTSFLTKAPPPPPPLPPPPKEVVSTGIVRYSEGYYKATLDDAAKRWKLEPPAPARMAEPFEYANELEHPRQLKAEKDALDTRHLHLTTHILKEWAQTASGERYRYEHIVLSITNKTDKHVAYRVETELEHAEKCNTKGAIGHNALALAPNETIERTECLWRPKAILTVKRVEVMELPVMGYYFVSRLLPTQVLLDERTSAGHEFGKVKLCAFVPWREIQVAAKEQGTTWADVIDFYARHDCNEYSFWSGYKRWRQAGKLPAKPPTLTYNK